MPGHDYKSATLQHYNIATLAMLKLLGARHNSNEFGSALAKRNIKRFVEIVCWEEVLTVVNDNIYYNIYYH